MPKVKKIRRIHRSAETGEYVTKEFADQHPKETVSEKVEVERQESGAEPYAGVETNAEV